MFNLSGPWKGQNLFYCILSDNTNDGNTRFSCFNRVQHTYINMYIEGNIDYAPYKHACNNIFRDIFFILFTITTQVKGKEIKTFARVDKQFFPSCNISSYLIISTIMYDNWIIRYTYKHKRVLYKLWKFSTWMQNIIKIIYFLEKKLKSFCFPLLLRSGRKVYNIFINQLLTAISKRK